MLNNTIFLLCIIYVEINFRFLLKFMISEDLRFFLKVLRIFSKVLRFFFEGSKTYPGGSTNCCEGSWIYPQDFTISPEGFLVSQKVCSFFQNILFFFIYLKVSCCIRKFVRFFWIFEKFLKQLCSLPRKTIFLKSLTIFLKIGLLSKIW